MATIIVSQIQSRKHHAVMLLISLIYIYIILSKESCATFCRKDVFLVDCTHHDLAVRRRVKTLLDGLVSDDLHPP